MIPTWLTIVATVYGTFGTVFGSIVVSVFRETGLPWYLVPFMFLGGFFTWPLVLIDYLRGDPWAV